MRIKQLHGVTSVTLDLYSEYLILLETLSELYILIDEEIKMSIEQKTVQKNRLKNIEERMLYRIKDILGNKKALKYNYFFVMNSLCKLKYR